jgi:pimeloyl-ACP methyl ester carboxylesterase
MVPHMFIKHVKHLVLYVIVIFVANSNVFAQQVDESNPYTQGINQKLQFEEGSVVIDDALLERNFLKPFKPDDRKFTQPVILQAAWLPLQFIRDVGYGLYIDEPLVKNKPLLVLVHGINDSPRRWQPLLKKLDHEKFQVLRFHYPGGMSIDVTAQVLAQMLHRVLLQSPKSDIVIVAHSMGGLVSRAAIQYLETFGNASSVKEFFSIATPWGGHQLASIGIQQSPLIVPVWRDLALESEFFQGIYSRRLPATVRFNLLYASGGGIEIFGEPNDGVVTVKSQLDERARREAVQVRNINAAHIPALVDKDTVSLINTALFAVALADE